MSQVIPHVPTKNTRKITTSRKQQPAHQKVKNNISSITSTRKSGIYNISCLKSFFLHSSTTFYHQNAKYFQNNNNNNITREGT